MLFKASVVSTECSKDLSESLNLYLRIWASRARRVCARLFHLSLRGNRSFRVWDEYDIWY